MTPHEEFVGIMHQTSKLLRVLLKQHERGWDEYSSYCEFQKTYDDPKSPNVCSHIRHMPAGGTLCTYKNCPFTI